jgi:energy-coupling factor transporter ATP-binding protein EcfA2
VKSHSWAEVLVKRAQELCDQAEKRERGEEFFTHVPTGLKSVDSVYGGLETGVMTLLVGHTGDGKSAVMKQFAAGAAAAGLGVQWFVLEDPLRRMADRDFATQTGIASHKLGRMTDVPPPAVLKQQLQAALKNLGYARRIKVYTGAMGPDDILEEVEKVKFVGKAKRKLVLVDYAQALNADSNELEKVCAETARGLNVAAGEDEDDQIAAVFGSQVRTQVLDRGKARWDSREEVDGFRPGKGDAMWSQRLMQYSKAVCTIFRPGRWSHEMGGGGKDNRLELNWVKANFGPEGRIVLRWDGATTSIHDLEKGEADAERRQRDAPSVQRGRRPERG